MRKLLLQIIIFYIFGIITVLFWRGFWLLLDKWNVTPELSFVIGSALYLIIVPATIKYTKEAPKILIAPPTTLEST